MDGVEIAFTERGAGTTTLVFVHGGLADRTFWASQMEALAQRYTVVALDLGGHGASGRDRKRWSIPTWGDDVWAVVDAVILTGRGHYPMLERPAEFNARLVEIVSALETR